MTDWVMFFGLGLLTGVILVKVIEFIVRRL